MGFVTSWLMCLRVCLLIQSLDYKNRIIVTVILANFQQNHTWQLLPPSLKSAVSTIDQESGTAF